MSKVFSNVKVERLSSCGQQNWKGVVFDSCVYVRLSSEVIFRLLFMVRLSSVLCQCFGRLHFSRLHFFLLTFQFTIHWGQSRLGTFPFPVDQNDQCRKPFNFLVPVFFQPFLLLESTTHIRSSLLVTNICSGLTVCRMSCSLGYVKLVKV